MKVVAVKPPIIKADATGRCCMFSFQIKKKNVNNNTDNLLYLLAILKDEVYCNYLCSPKAFKFTCAKITCYEFGNVYCFSL